MFEFAVDDHVHDYLECRQSLRLESIKQLSMPQRIAPGVLVKALLDNFSNHLNSWLLFPYLRVLSYSLGFHCVEINVLVHIPVSNASFSSLCVDYVTLKALDSLSFLISILELIV